MYAAAGYAGAAVINDNAYGQLLASTTHRPPTGTEGSALHIWTADAVFLFLAGIYYVQHHTWPLNTVHHFK
jgi:hypothetical protein